jgi:hypothetical protein
MMLSGIFWVNTILSDVKAKKSPWPNAALLHQIPPVLRYENDPNKVVHFSKWASIAKAKAFFESPKLVDIRKQAGVEAPEFIYLHQLEAGIL